MKDPPTENLSGVCVCPQVIDIQCKWQLDLPLVAVKDCHKCLYICLLAVLHAIINHMNDMLVNWGFLRFSEYHV